MENFIFSTLQESNIEFLSSPFLTSQKQLTGGELCRCPARALGADTGGFGETALSAPTEKGRKRQGKPEWVQQCCPPGVGGVWQPRLGILLTRS